MLSVPIETVHNNCPTTAIRRDAALLQHPACNSYGQRRNQNSRFLSVSLEKTWATLPLKEKCTVSPMRQLFFSRRASFSGSQFDAVAADLVEELVALALELRVKEVHGGRACC